MMRWPISLTVLLPYAMLSSAFLFDFDSLNLFGLPNGGQQEYDFIIVGAGSAGSVLASRLSEDSRVRVLLIEAGGDPTIFNEIPMLCPTLANTDMDWKYRTVPQKNMCGGCEDQVAIMPRGKVVGGTSEINCMLYVRGNKHDFDNWKSMGNYGWGYDDVLPYYLKSEDNTDREMLKNKKYHRAGGYLTVSNLTYQTPIISAFLKSGKETGYTPTDINAEKQTGIMNVQTTTRNGARCSARKAFLQPAQSRSNLIILKNTLVTKVVLENKIAVGIEYLNGDGSTTTIRATKEVIVSAGAINTPQILMLSGIGPRKHLESLNINVIADVPGVGNNFQDHTLTYGLIWNVDADITFLDVSNILDLITKGAEWFLAGTGPLSSTSGLEGTGFIKTALANQSIDWPDVQIEVLAISKDLPYDERARKLQGFATDVFSQFFVPAMKKNAFAILTILLHSKSRGTIKLHSASPTDYPIIDPNYLAVEEDRQRLLEGIKIAFRIGNSEAFKNIGAKFYMTPVTGCENIKHLSDDYWLCVIRRITVSGFHPSGTSKMGPCNDEMAVVDPELRVRGVTNLRVVDASVMPESTSGNLNAPTIMIAEKAADIMKDYWKNKNSNPRCQ